MSRYILLLKAIIFFSSCRSTLELQNQIPLGTYYSSAGGSPGEIKIRSDSTAVIVIIGWEYMASGEGVWQQINKNTLMVKLDTVKSILELTSSGEFWNRRPVIYIKGFNSIEFENEFFFRSSVPPIGNWNEEINDQIKIRDHIHKEMAKNEKGI